MPDSIKSPVCLTDKERLAAGASADAVDCFRLIAFASQRLRQLMDRRLKEDGLTSQQGFLQTIVRIHGRPTLGQVAAAMSTTHQNAKQVALALERKGMLRIVPDGKDARVKRLETTETGASGWIDRDADDHKAIANWFAALSGDEQRLLMQLLSRLAVSLPRS